MSLPALTYFDRERLSELTLSDDELLEITTEERKQLEKDGTIAKMISSILSDPAAADIKDPLDILTLLSEESYLRGFYSAMHYYRAAVAKMISSM